MPSRLDTMHTVFFYNKPFVSVRLSESKQKQETRHQIQGFLESRKSEKRCGRRDAQSGIRNDLNCLNRVGLVAARQKANKDRSTGTVTRNAVLAVPSRAESDRSKAQ